MTNHLGHLFPSKNTIQFITTWILYFVVLAIISIQKPYSLSCCQDLETQHHCSMARKGKKPLLNPQFSPSYLEDFVGRLPCFNFGLKKT